MTKKSFSVIIYSFFLLLFFSVVAILGYVLFSFTPMPKDIAVRQVLVDEFSQIYYVTEDNQLYVGGNNTDHLGFYDTDVRWGTLFALRRFLGKEDAVLFAEQVSQVYPSEDGVLYTDLDGSLYYFGELNGGKLTKIADNVEKASLSSFGGVYLAAADSNAYYFWWDYDNKEWTEPTVLMGEIRDVAINGSYIRLLTEQGQIFQRSIFRGLDFIEKESFLVTGDAVKMWTSIETLLIQKEDDTYELIRFENGHNYQVQSLKDRSAASSNPDDIIVDAELKDLYAGDYYLTESGNIYEIEEDASALIATATGSSVKGLSASSTKLYVVSDDGSHEEIPLR